jgi:hypothetical protein
MSQQELQALLVRTFHTFWQSFLAVFLLGIFSVISDVLSTGSFSGAKSALLALVVASAAAGLSALKNAYVRPVEAK